MDPYTPPTGLPFRPGSMTRKINMEPVVALGGGRALLLQVLHPLVAAGVEQYSNFTEDPFRRGFRTADVMLKLAFADAPTSRHQAKVLERIHRQVKGVSSDGVAYDAMDPALLLWVWATLVDVSLLIYEQGIGPLSEVERERYYEEQKLIAYACGIPKDACPPTYRDFIAYLERMIDQELCTTSCAKLVAYAGRKPPLPRPLGPLAGVVGTFFSAGLLPERFRGDLGYVWSPARERMLRFAFFGSRLMTHVVPRGARRLLNRYLIARKTPLGLWRNRPIDVPEDLAS